MNFFRANETVYLVMRYEHGRTLQEHIQHRRGGIKEDFLRRVFTLLLNGLREVHEQAATPGPQADQHLHPQRRLSGIDRFWRRAADSYRGNNAPESDVYAGLRLAEQYHKRELLGP